MIKRACHDDAGRLRRILRLRGGLEISSNDDDDDDDDDDDGDGDSEDAGGQSDMDDESAEGAGKEGGKEGESAGDSKADEEVWKRKRRTQRGPKDDPNGKRKHRGRRGGKHAKAARLKRDALPLDESMLGEIKSIATTLAEISAAAPHAAEHAAPSLESDPIMRYMQPDKFDGLDDLKRSTIFDERHELLDIGPEFSERLHGTAPPLSWLQTWFPPAAPLFRGTLQMHAYIISCCRQNEMTQHPFCTFARY